MILVIDNYDSFTYNLVQYVGEIGHEVAVCRNDAITIAEIRAMAPAAIILSPGPGTPDGAGVTLDVVRTLGSSVPMLGVCLGHQAIGAAYGGRVVRAARPMHGKASLVRHESVEMFEGVPSPFRAMRYHSLTLEPSSMPAALQVTAWSDDDEIQAVRHREYRVFGVQFHPESVLTEHGKDIVRNFLELAQ